MKEVSLLFSRPVKFNWISALIMRYLGTPYSHVAVEVKIDSLGESIVYEATWWGIVCKGKARWIEKNITVHEKKFRFPKEDYRAIQKYCIRQLGKPYGFRNFLALITNYKCVTDGEKSFICSELAYRVISKKIDIGKDPDYVTPRDLYEAVK
ncbi:MAG: hypothetical protein GY777_15890 [Candidatus Brocadiaceae bacterium]|nr:hypothetical protein [Candidatus Brocadiaceae bacterium]